MARQQHSPDFKFILHGAAMAALELIFDGGVGGERARRLKEPDDFADLHHFRPAVDLDADAGAGEVGGGIDLQHGIDRAYGVIFDVEVDVLEAEDAPAGGAADVGVDD